MTRAERFRLNPTINPSTQEPVIIGSKEYNKLEEKYGPPLKIKSPKTQKKISVNKGEYKKLIKEGYTDDQLLYNKPVENKENKPKTPVKNVESKEIIIHLLLIQSRNDYPDWSSPYIIAAPSKNDLLTKFINYMDDEEWNGHFNNKKKYISFITKEFEKLKIDDVKCPELDKAYCIMYKITTM